MEHCLHTSNIIILRLVGEFLQHLKPENRKFWFDVNIIWPDILLLNDKSRPRDKYQEPRRAYLSHVTDSIQHIHRTRFPITFYWIACNSYVYQPTVPFYQFIHIRNFIVNKLVTSTVLLKCRDEIRKKHWTCTYIPNIHMFICLCI